MFSLQNQFKEYVTLDGINHKARFGLSVACAGNLNLDGLSEGNRRGVEVSLEFSTFDNNINQYYAILI